MKLKQKPSGIFFVEEAPTEKWLGHADIAITAKRYAHLASSDLVGGLSVLNTNPANAGDKFRNPESHYNGIESNGGSCHANNATLRH